MSNTGRLTTHVLNTSHGIPASSMVINLYQVFDSKSVLLKTVSTNSDGRCDAPLLVDDDFIPSTYELHFHVSAYFKSINTASNDFVGDFLDIVPIRFKITQPNIHYHVPLLVSPYGYTTYKGS